MCRFLRLCACCFLLCLRLGAQEGVNLALNKPITGTGPTWPGYPAANLTDGNHDTFTHPEAATDVSGYYFQVDLGRIYGLDRIVLWSRSDGCCPERLTQYRIEVYGDRDGETGDLTWRADFRSDGSFTPSGGSDPISAGADPTGVFAGRFVRVLNNGGAAYSPQLAEIEVFGAAGPRIVRFDADDESVPVGLGTQLRWQVENATNVVLQPGNVALGMSGAYEVKPATTTEYRLVAEGPGGISEARITVGVGVVLGTPRITEFLADNQAGEKDEDGDSVDWVEVANTNQFRMNLEGYYLTDDPKAPSKWRFPAMRVAAGGSVVVRASGKNRRPETGELHTNFKLDADGDYLALVAPDGLTVLQQFPSTYPAAKTFPKQRADVSYGTDAEGREGYMRPTTPGEPNGSAYAGVVADTRFSVHRGLYDTNVVLEIQTATPGAEIRFTTDRTDPTATSGRVYTEPLVLTNTTVVKAAAFLNGWAPTDVDAHTYLFPSNLIAAATMRTSITRHAVYGPMMRGALGDLPSVSLNTRAAINDTTEVKTSFEWIPDDGGKGIHVDCGIQRFGGAFTDFAKKSFRLYFRSKYGASRLKYPVFDGADRGMPALDEFDQLELRNGSHDMEMRGFYMSNIFTDDTMQEMGHLNPHGRFVHLYVNNVYWGVYHLRERWGAAMHSKYLGGSKTDYESINGNWNVGGWAEPGTPYDGDGAVWTRIKSLRGSYNSVKPWLDVPEYVDYMLMWMFGGSEDEYRSVGPTVPGSGMKFYLNDADGWFCGSWYCDAGDRSRRGAPGRAAGDGPGSILSTLVKEGDPEFQMLLADHIHAALFRDGALTPHALTNRLMDRFNTIRRAFLAESARWNYLSPTVWTNRRDAVLGGWLKTRTAEVLGQWRAGGFYPTTDAPVYEPDGGIVPTGYTLRFAGAPQGTVYYTVDGSDPRLPGGGVSPKARHLKSGASRRVIVPLGSVWRWYTDAAGLGSSALVEGAPTWSASDWKHPAFDDTAWTSGPGQLGYGEGDEATTVPFGPDGSKKWVSSYFRHAFTLASTEGLSGLELQLRRDDGAIVYVNGRETARSSMPEGEVVGTTAGLSPSDDGQNLQTISIPADLLKAGRNVIAVEVHQSAPGTSDLSFDLGLTALETGSDQGGDPLPVFTTNTLVQARSLEGTRWSALNAAFFQVGDSPAALGDVVISEMKIFPPAPLDTEFIELRNVSARAVNLRGARFTNGIDYAFSPYRDEVLAPGDRRLLVRNLFDFRQRYGLEIPVDGIYRGSLDNGGEELALVDRSDTPLMRVKYGTQAPWPAVGTGNDTTVVLVAPELGMSNPAAWRLSSTPGGNPGGPDSSRFSGVVGQDVDGDGFDVLLEYALGTDDTNERRPGALHLVAVAGDAIEVETSRRLEADDVDLWLESSPDLQHWERMVVVRQSTDAQGLGVITWSASLGETGIRFVRAAAQLRP